MRLSRRQLLDQFAEWFTQTGRDSIAVFFYTEHSMDRRNIERAGAECFTPEFIAKEYAGRCWQVVLDDE